MVNGAPVLEHKKVVRVLCFKPTRPAQPRAPIFEELRHLASLELA